MIAAKEADGASAVYLTDLGKRLSNFAADFQCDLLRVTEPAVTTWLREKWKGGRNRNNFRSAIATLYRWAAAEELAPKDHLEFSRIPKAKESQSEIDIFRPEEMARPIANLSPQKVPPPGYKPSTSG